jgi:hypothetical protein
MPVWFQDVLPGTMIVQHDKAAAHPAKRNERTTQYSLRLSPLDQASFDHE